MLYFCLLYTSKKEAADLADVPAPFEVRLLEAEELAERKSRGEFGGGAFRHAVCGSQDVYKRQLHGRSIFSISCAPSRADGAQNQNHRNENEQGDDRYQFLLI